MWLFTTQGFVSIVSVPDMPDWLLVRARKRQHLVNLQKGGRTGYPIQTTPKSDYKYRMLVPRPFVQTILRRALDQIDYTNFKDAAHAASPKDQAWHRALGNVWMDMYEFQEPRPLPPPATLDDLDALERRLGIDRTTPPPPQEG